MKNGGLLKENKVFWVMFLMEEYGKNLMVKNKKNFTEEGNYGVMLNVDWFHLSNIQTVQLV